ncbi:MAG: histidine kinase [Rhodobacteraceae bacterium]|nr:histidine kinase [Paracoccaceae bacterium]
MGRIFVILLLGSTVLAGAGVWYMQVYALYDRLPEQDSVPLTPLAAAAPQEFPVRNFQGIDSTSSPIRYRACFDIDADPAQFTPYPDPTPLVAPGWFDCFDAGALTEALGDGRATAVMGVSHLAYGIDRVVVLMDGRGYAWQQINPCGTAHFDGDPVPPGCPTPPED